MTCTRDALYRALYLRREYALVCADGDPSITLTPPLDDPQPGGGAAEGADDPAVWAGVVYVRRPSSPWCGGVFSFTVRFPASYPFERPEVLFQRRLPSHPLLREADAATQFFFDNVYLRMVPTQRSVMAALLKFIVAMFDPTAGREEPVDGEAGVIRSHADLCAALRRVNKLQARQDVKQCSVTQEVELRKPFAAYVARDASEFAVRLAAAAPREVGRPRGGRLDDDSDSDDDNRHGPDGGGPRRGGGEQPGGDPVARAWAAGERFSWWLTRDYLTQSRGVQ